MIEDQLKVNHKIKKSGIKLNSLKPYQVSARWTVLLRSHSSERLGHFHGLLVLLLVLSMLVDGPSSAGEAVVELVLELLLSVGLEAHAGSDTDSVHTLESWTGTLRPRDP